MKDGWFYLFMHMLLGCGGKWRGLLPYIMHLILVSLPGKPINDRSFFCCQKSRKKRGINIPLKREAANVLFIM
jgi:hypothetical protein